MDIKVAEMGPNLTVLAPMDRLDAFSAQTFRQLAGECMDAGRLNFLVDLSATPFLDSAGMAALVSLLKRSRQVGGNVSLVWPKHEPVKRILLLTRFDRVFAGYDTREEAVDVLTAEVETERPR